VRSDELALPRHGVPFPVRRAGLLSRQGEELRLHSQAEHHLGVIACGFRDAQVE